VGSFAGRETIPFKNEGSAMKKTVLVFGLISGAISAAMMLMTVSVEGKIGQGKAEIIGYTTMILALLLVFFGVRSYRENVSGGKLTFGRGFLVGILITLISSTCYVGAWEFVQHRFYPDFADKYAAQMVERAKSKGASAERIAVVAKQADDFKRMYANPVINVGMTFMEIFPVGLLVTLVTAAALRRKEARPAA
jgi:hypothetical protein